MTFYEEYKKGHLVVPAALLENFNEIFDSSEEFLVWLFFLYEKESAPSDIAEKIGKTLNEVNTIIQRMQDSAVLKVTVIEISGQMDMIFDVSPAMEKLDSLLEGKISRAGKTDNAKNTSKLQKISHAFEAEMGMISPMQLEELRKWLEIDQFNVDLILAALREASINRKVSLNYVRAILRHWKMEGISTVKEVEIQREEREISMQTKNANSEPSSNLTIPIDGPWSKNNDK
ncbi:DnaD domain-containing protein [Lactovum miscens]|uniref:DNA replication protein n=1 Tax=Lactovum miscens TaxID=190387 RepID=A0A841C976_9LACT|nr:DnaD domain-containing protein [Lactovum miscens]MBB5888142.1 DNA replication protein [Lactovum miscens]